MILIVGLGNPGEKYGSTRHNIGFLVMDHLLNKLAPVKESLWKKDRKFNSLMAKSGNDLILAKPMSFMNASGEVIQKIMKFYKIPVFGLYVVHDDLDLPLGKIKISFGHGSAGHKGVGSIIQKTKSNNFVRVRVGIGKDKKIDPDKYVLLNFKKEERGRLGRVVKKAAAAIEMILEKGVEKAANRYN